MSKCDSLYEISHAIYVCCPVRSFKHVLKMLRFRGFYIVREFMNFRLSFFSSVFLFATNICASSQPIAAVQPIAIIKEAKIIDRANEIRQMIKKHRIIQASMIVGSGAMQLMQLYQMWQLVFGKREMIAKPEDKKAVEAPVSQNNDSIWASSLRSLEYGVKRLGSGVKNLFFSKDGWFILFGLLGGTVVQKLVNRYIHPDTLHWFVYAHVPYKRTVRLMDGFVEKCEDEQLLKTQKKFYHESLINAANQLVEYVEKMCGYIAYKSDSLPGIQRTTGYSIGRYIFNRTNDWSREITKLFNKKDINYQVVKTSITGFVIELKQQLEHFASIESESEEDRLRVKYAAQI